MVSYRLLAVVFLLVLVLATATEAATTTTTKTTKTTKTKTTKTTKTSKTTTTKTTTTTITTTPALAATTTTKTTTTAAATSTTKTTTTAAATTTTKTTTTAAATTTTKTTTTSSQAAATGSSDILLTVTGVKGTYWDTQTDGGGCQMPEGTYAVADALSLGQATALGPLIYKPGLCGQVLRINCGGTSVDAVVASTCNLGEDTCGLDIILRTWNTATGNLPPGSATCSVSLTTKNPLPGSSPICYYRPSSDLDNAYYVILGVLNTSGKLVASATAAGVVGTHSNGGWYEFNGNGQGLFVATASIVFTYEDGSTSVFALKDCVKPTGTHIFS